MDENGYEPDPVAGGAPHGAAPSSSPEPSGAPSPPVGRVGARVRRRRLLAAAGAVATAVGAVVILITVLSGGSTPAPSDRAGAVSSRVPTTVGVPPSTTETTTSSTSPSASSTTPTTSVPVPVVGASSSTDSSTTSAPTASTEPVVPIPSNEVTVVGDSITALSESDITRALSRDWTPDVHAVVRTQIPYWTPFIASVVQNEPPHDWIVELGTNDVFDANPDIQSDFSYEVSQLAGQRCVILVTVQRYDATAVQLDQSMASVAAGDPVFHVLDWGAAMLQNPRWLGPDRVHPTRKGSAELARLERRALASDCS